MNIYIDNDYKCHVTDDGAMRAFDVPFFDGKCAEFVEGYRYVPSGETWTRADGQTFTGEMITPWRDYAILAELQALYEEEQAKQADMQAALAILGVTINE